MLQELSNTQMAYNEELAERVRKLLCRRKNFSERKMFGGICFMLGGNMCCGVLKKNLMLRLGNEKAEKALNEEPFTKKMDFTGRSIKSMIYVEPKGFKEDEDLKKWINKAASFAASLPLKEK